MQIEHGGPPVKIGDIVDDLGCLLSQEIRESNGEPPPFGVVVAVFDWGIRLRDPMSHEWDCDRWRMHVS